MGIERTDSKGCLNRTEAGGLMVYTVILYDAVAGGAGHVRRMVTEEGEAFQQVLQRIMVHYPTDGLIQFFPKLQGSAITFSATQI